jgi:hypothetical protein
MPIFKGDYSRDLRPAKWGLGVGLHGSLSRSGPLAEWLPPANAIIPARNHLLVAGELDLALQDVKNHVSDFTL